MDWLKSGYTHCQYGSEEWCQAYLTNAHDYIVALETEAQCDREYVDAQRCKIEELNDKIDGLESDLTSAVEVAFKRGATEWTRLNYPDLYRKLSEASDASV
jgi:hypothetical protein